MRELTERIDKWERDQDSFRHIFTSQDKEDNQKLISTMEGILDNLQKEREKEETAAPEPKKKRGVCFICSDPDHYAPDCPNKPEKKPAGSYKPPNAYYQKGASNTSNAYYQKGASNGYQSRKPKQDAPTIAERKQNSNCYQCGQQGHWASECPIKDIPEYNQEFWQDVDSMVKEELGSEYQEPDPLPTPPAPPAPVPTPATPAPKKRKLSLKKQ